jgi:hypothetical protein
MMNFKVSQFERAPRGAEMEWEEIPTTYAGKGESLGRSVRRMQTGGETAAPERYWCGAMQTAKKPGLAER